MPLYLYLSVFEICDRAIFLRVARMKPTGLSRSTRVLHSFLSRSCSWGPSCSSKLGVGEAVPFSQNVFFCLAKSWLCLSFEMDGMPHSSLQPLQAHLNVHFQRHDHLLYRTSVVLVDSIVMLSSAAFEIQHLKLDVWSCELPFLFNIFMQHLILFHYCQHMPACKLRQLLINRVTFFVKINFSWPLADISANLRELYRTINWCKLWCEIITILKLCSDIFSQMKINLV